MNIVLVHGFFSTNKIFFLMKKKFEKNGFTCFAPTLRPINAKYGIENLGEKLKSEIDFHLGDKEEFSLVGFSMGGIVCRYYLQELGGVSRVKNFITISVPHKGTLTAYLFPSKGVRQLRPNSEFLKNLLHNELVLTGLTLYSLRTPFDLMITPSNSSLWEIAHNKKYNSIVHSFMLFNTKLIKDIISLLKSTQ